MYWNVNSPCECTTWSKKSKLFFSWWVVNCNNPFIPHARPPHIVKCCTFSWFHWLFTLAAHPLDRSMDCGTVSWWIHVERGTSSAFLWIVSWHQSHPAVIHQTRRWNFSHSSWQIGGSHHLENFLLAFTTFHRWPQKKTMRTFVRCHSSFHRWNLEWVRFKVCRFAVAEPQGSPVVNSRYYLETCWVHGEWVGAMFMDFSNISLLNPGA